MSSNLKGDMVFDTGALLELVALSPIGEKLKSSIIDGRITVNVSELSLVELYYITCRRLGPEKALSKYEDLRRSNYLLVTETSDLMLLAAKYKCERSISLVDCFSLALGEHLRLPVLFRMREQELVSELRRKHFDLKLVFLEDYEDSALPS